MPEQNNPSSLTMTTELVCFIWSELELREQRWPVYNQCNIGAYEVMHAVHEIAEHYRPVAASSNLEWLDVLYAVCGAIAEEIHKFMRNNRRMPTWSELGIESWSVSSIS